MEDDSKYFYVWVIADSTDYEIRIVAELINAGYDVDPISTEFSMYYEGSPSCVLALRLLTLEDDVATIYSDMHNALKKAGCKYHALIVSEATQCMWVGGNIFSQTEKPKKFKSVSN